MESQADPPRIVLDTNVWLDLLLFDDPRTARLHAALTGGDLVAVADEAGRSEWRRVLRYPVLRLDEDACGNLEKAFDALARHWPARADSASLPRCADPDDQKFLELAHRAGARWLLSRDRALLVLDRRCRREGRFGILTPEAWSLQSPSGIP